MADTNVTKVYGLPELSAALKGKEITPDIAQRAALVGAYVLQAFSKLYCPVRTGNLRNSILVELLDATQHLAEAIIYTVVHYAPYVEFGTRFMKARPFMRKAFDKNSQDAVDAVGFSIKNDLELF